MQVRLLGSVGAAVLAVAAAGCGNSHPAASTAAPRTIPATPVSLSPTASSAPSPSPTASSPSPTASPTPTGPQRCRVSQLALSFGMGQGGVGHIGVVLVLHNTSSVTCTLDGYVGMQLDNSARQFMPTSVVRGSGYLYRDPGPHPLTVAPGGAVSAGVEWDHIPSAGDPNPCPTSSYLEVTPPNATNYLFAARAIQACNHGQLIVTALQAGDQGPS